MPPLGAQRAVSTVARESAAAAQWVCAALVLAVLCNGLGTYLRKVGLSEPEAYRAYWAVHCGEISHLPPAQRELAGCCWHATANERARMEQPPLGTKSREAAQYIFSATSAERILKLVKDALILGLIAGSICWVLRKGCGVSGLTLDGVPGIALLTYGTVMFGLSWYWHGWVMPAVGLRSMLFVGVFVLCAWMRHHFDMLARCLGVAVTLQLLMVPWELLAGIHINGHGHALALGELGTSAVFSRVSGSLALPNSLGVFVVTSLAFCHSFSSGRKWLVGLGIATVALLYLSGSGVGTLALLLLLLILVWRKVPQQQRRWVWLATPIVGALCLTALPTLLGRPDLYQSVLGAGGRLDMLKQAVQQQSSIHLWVGQGLGVNTNLALNLDLVPFNPNVVDAGMRESEITSGTDSTLTSLLIQLGVVGVVMFYGALFWAARCDHPARPFYAVVALCSLALNITEVFPVNLLLGLALARSMTLLRASTPGCSHV